MGEMSLLCHLLSKTERNIRIKATESIISSINATTSDLRKTISAYSNQSNIDTIFEAFANEIQYTGLPFSLLYLTSKDEFVYLQNSNGNNMFVALPGDFNDPSGGICMQSRALGSGRNLNFTFGNFSYHAMDRPWYKLASSLDASSSKLQFTEPYVYAVGSRVNISNVVTGIYVYNIDSREDSQAKVGNKAAVPKVSVAVVGQSRLANVGRSKFDERAKELIPNV
ncbi:hypothetical protein BJ741DRAFT_671821 [Chytriomyces cf. hyalinus JEL632]|nr:hypothetical protein BJ741DRAFT_671821 [Chytriomyces cf. hyalinus JEL632]